MHTKLIGVVLALALAGCASEPAVEKAPPAAATADAVAVKGTKLAVTDKPEAKSVAEAQKLGYKIVNQNGKTMYCRDTPKLGSRIQREVTCLTAAELDQLKDASQRDFENLKRTIPPPHGT